MDIKPRRKRCEKGILRRKTERRKCYPQEIPEDKILLTFCPQTYHLLWIKIFSISAHLPTLSKKHITGVGVKSNDSKWKNKKAGKPSCSVRHFLIKYPYGVLP